MPDNAAISKYKAGTKDILFLNLNILLFFLTVLSEFILKLGQGLCSPAHDKTFFFFCHNKAGGVRGDTGGVRDPA